MADALVWQLIRSNNSFLVKRGQTKRDGSVQFSSEKGNLLNVNSFKYSGIANSSTVAVQLTDKGVAFTTKVISIPTREVEDYPRSCAFPIVTLTCPYFDMKDPSTYLADCEIL
jgi:hypothetical protein